MPTHNNISQEQDWCVPCNQPYNQTSCQNGEFSQSLVAQVEPTRLRRQQFANGSSHPQGDTTFVNWWEVDFYEINQTSADNVANNTSSKRRAIDPSVSSTIEAKTP